MENVATKKVKAILSNTRPYGMKAILKLGRKEALENLVDLYPTVIVPENFEEHWPKIQDTEVVFTTWGMSEALAIKLCSLPNLKAVFYGAGTVQAFARPLLKKGIVLMSAWGANAVPVAQYTLSQSLLSLKCYYQNLLRHNSPENRGRQKKLDAPGIFIEPVALLGCGMIGTMVAELLRGLNVPVWVFDKYITDERLSQLGAKRVSLEEAFSGALVVSNHLANLPSTQQMLKGHHFASMRENATFINTGRGATLDEKAMIEVLQKRLDICALLDVTDPEPPSPTSPMYAMTNVFLTPHIAGSMGDETARMADYAMDEFKRWSKGEPMKYRVTEEMLESMA